MQYTLQTPQQLQQQAAQLAHQHSLVMLHGELGAGKTTFVKGYAQGLGIDPQQVTSPTYTYMQIYDETLLHIDMRRIEDADQAAELGIRDMMDTYEHIVIERPKFLTQRADNRRLNITIKKQPDGSRLLEKNMFEAELLS